MVARSRTIRCFATNALRASGAMLLRLEADNVFAHPEINSARGSWSSIGRGRYHSSHLSRSGGAEFTSSDFFLYQEQLVTSGIDDAARYLALSSDPASVTTQADVKKLAVTGSMSGGEPRVRGWSTFDVTVSVDTVDNTAGTYSGGADDSLRNRLDELSGCDTWISFPATP